jgi:hypothetical protein
MAASVRRTVDPQLFARDPYAFYLIALEILRSADPRDLSPAQRHHYAIDFCIESVRKGGLEQFCQAASPAQVEATTAALAALGKQSACRVLLEAIGQWNEGVTSLPALNVRFGELLPDVQDTLFKHMSTHEAEYVDYERKG